MASAERSTAASAERVFEVLSDGWTYPLWVVGTSHMRAVEAGWPAVGTRLHHASGAWPAVLRDQTEVEAVTPGERIVLTASGRPFGSARIEISVLSQPVGARIAMRETPVSGPGSWVDNPVLQRLLRRRIVETLARLAAVAERPTEPLD